MPHWPSRRSAPGLTRCVSIRSTSWNVIVPVAVGVPSSATPPESGRRRRRRDGRRILGAGDRHRDVLGDHAAMLVVDADGVGLGDDLADRQLLRQSVVDRKGPVHRADDCRCRCARSASASACRAAGSSDRSPAAPTMAEPPVSAWLTRWVSIRSTSWNVIVPVAVCWPSSTTPPDVEAAVVAAVMVGASSVPVIVTVTSCVITAAMLVVDADGVGLGDDLADRQLLRQRVVDRKGPVHRADDCWCRCSRSASAPACRAAGSPDQSPAAPSRPSRRSAPG